jgi:hypothetical protein
MKDKYPEHTKLKEIQPQSQKVGEFLEWLQENGYTICTFDKKHGEYASAYISIPQMLAKFFEIDSEKIEAEKQAMLEEIRRSNEEK